MFSFDLSPDWESKQSYKVLPLAADQSFAVIGPTLWNCLPCQLTTIECPSSFKAKISALIYSLLDEPPVSGYMRAHAYSLT